MPTKRQKQLVSIAISHLNSTYDQMVEYLRYDAEDNCDIARDDDLVEVKLNGGCVVFAPSDEEFCAVLTREKGKKGNKRTREVLQVALWWASVDLDMLINDHPYEGTIESHADTHVTLGDINFRAPTVQEFQDAADEVESFYRHYRCLPIGTVEWDVYGPTTDPDTGEVYFGLIDTVFYDGDCARDYVRSGLIGHDGYDSQIEITPRRFFGGKLVHQ